MGCAGRVVIHIGVTHLNPSLGREGFIASSFALFLSGGFRSRGFFSGRLGSRRCLGNGFSDRSFFSSGFLDDRRLGGFGSGFVRGINLGLALFGALLGLLAGDTLVRVAAGGALLDTGGVEEAGNAIGRLRADRQPMLGALGVDLDAVGVILGEERVVRTDLLDEGAVGRAGRLGADVALNRALLGGATGETDGHGH